MEKMNVAFCFNDRYTSKIAVTITSLLVNHINSYFDFYLFSSDLSEESIKLINCLSASYDNFKLHHVKVDKNIFSGLALNIHHITTETYFRYIIPELLPQVDKILYLDGDIVVNSCIYNFYDTKLENNYFAGVADRGVYDMGYHHKLNLEVYVNAGVLLMNLKQMRQDCLFKKLLGMTIKLVDLVKYQDQDILNIVCKDHIVLVDSIYNFATENMCKEKDRRFMAVIVHYTGPDKPWNATVQMGEIWKRYDYLFDKVLMDKHIKKCYETPLYEKNGVICYTYNDGIDELGFYCPQYLNIGDYVQSLAAKQFLSNIDVFVDRDQLGEYSGEKINMIMNAFYALWKKNEGFNDLINPLFVAVHLSQPEKISEKTIAYLKKHEPIGCRDFDTRDFLRSKGVQAYFSGCLTLTLGCTYALPKHLNREKKIYYVDWSPASDPRIFKRIKKTLSLYKECDSLSLTHEYHSSDVFSLEEAESLIKLYARASLVITTRIHVALPCLAMGVPTILVVPSFDKARFGGLIDLLNHIGYDQNGHFMEHIQMDEMGYVKNSEEFIRYKNHLIRLCLAYTHQSEFNTRKIDWSSSTLSQKPEKVKTWSLVQKVKNQHRRTIYFCGKRLFKYSRKKKAF